MKHFLNSRANIVTEAIDGLLRTNGGALARIDGFPNVKVVIRADWKKAGVALVSGGGAGHEPSHAGFVGKGMLTAAVSGEIFASPSAEAVLTAIRAVTGKAGCLLIVKNYTGDRLNFGLAAEKARAEGLRVEMVIVGDDIALPDLPQPRGVAGTLFVHKIAGHMAEQGEDLATIADAVRKVAADTISLGMSLSSCSIPGQDHEERLGPGEGELGLGIHGEPGVECIAIESASKIVATMVKRLSKQVEKGRKHALIINNLGAVPPLEMSLLANAVLNSSLGANIDLVIGPAPLMTALNMNGFSLSLLALTPARKAALLSAVGPHAWSPARKPVSPKLVAAPKSPAKARKAAASRAPAVDRLIRAVCERIVSIEADLNRLDAKTGDGDTGTTLATGARGILGELSALPLADASQTAAAIGASIGQSMGGSSGVLLSIFFTAAARSLADGATLADALGAGLDRMTFYGGANPGDRTMVDALAPAIAALRKGGPALAATAAARGAQATAKMKTAKAGRSAYLGKDQLLGIVDPGAQAVAEAFAAAAEATAQG